MEYQNPYGDVSALESQFAAAQAEVDPRARLAYELSMMDYKRQEQERNQRGGGLIGFVMRMMQGEPDQQPVSAAMAAYFQEQEDAKTAAMIQQRLEKARGFDEGIAGANIKDRLKVQNSVEGIKSLGLSPEDERRALANIYGGGSGGTTVNIDQTGREALKYTFGEGGRLATLDSNATRAYQGLQRLEQLAPLIAARGTGKWQELAGNVGAWAPLFGLDEKAAQTQGLEKSMADFIPQALSAMQGYGQVSDTEFKKAMGILLDPGSTPEANMVAMNSLRNIAETQIRDADAAHKYLLENQGTPDKPGISMTHGLAFFRSPSSMGQRAELSMEGTGRGIEQPTEQVSQFRKGQTATGPNGEKVVFDGQQWVPQ